MLSVYNGEFIISPDAFGVDISIQGMSQSVDNNNVAKYQAIEELRNSGQTAHSLVGCRNE